LDLDEDGYKEPYIVTFGDGEVARIVACFDEEGVIANGKGIVRIDRIEYFTKYGFVPSPDGSFYDIGFGLLLGPINKSINTTLNQLHDAGTMATRAGGFLGRGAKIKGGKHAFKPFEWQNLQSTGDDIRKNIFPLPVREPSPVLFSLLGLLIEAGKELSSTVPMMMGQNPGQNQAATTSMAVIEQGLKVFSAIFKRLHRSLKSEAKKLKRLNRIYLPLEAYFQVLDPYIDQNTGVAGGAEKIWREDYSDDETDVQLYSDPNIISELQRTIKAQQIEQLMQGGHIPNPAAGSKLILEAMDLPNIEELMTPPEPQPNPEFELERMKVESEAQYKMGKLRGELAVMDAQVIQLEAKAMLDIAKAEAAEDGTQIEIYKTQLAELSDRRAGIQQLMDATEKQEMMEKEDESRGMGRMDGESDHQEVS
ncbi:MAG: hypothetical protein SVK08_10100, partial [Halobacteriota archaeon]|nr:hypothetical protein [Halobacteriota archaeon]